MKQTFRLKHVAGAAALAVASMSSHAACTTIGSTGTVDLKIAVASNFSAAAQSIATSFLAVGPKSYKIQICDGSSAALRADIGTTNPNGYALFLSADDIRPKDIADNTTLEVDVPFTYANGIPVFLLSPGAYSATSGSYRAVNYLQTGLGSGANGTRSDASLSAVSNKTKLKKSAPDTPLVTSLAIALPTDAPYGLQAQRLLGGTTDTAYVNVMNQWTTPTAKGTDTSSSCGADICTYNNVNTTLTAINNDKVTAGFVSYGQVCPTFTGSTYPLDSYVLYQEYLIQQDGILLNVSVGANAKAADFKDYMLITGAGAADWDTYLTNNCYAPL